MFSKKLRQIVRALSIIICVVMISSAEKTGAIQYSPNDKPVVGVYYYPWYRQPKEWRRVMRQHLKEPQEPKVGLYRSDDPNIVAEHIAQSVRGGISFWAVSWWGPGQHCDVTFRNAILTHPDAGKLKYAVLYESTGRLRRFRNPS